MKYASALVLMLFLGCSNKDSDVAAVQPNGQGGDISFSMSRTMIPQSVTSMTFTLINLATAETISKTVVVTSDSLMQVSFTEMSAGSWHVKVTAKDELNTIRYSGEADVVVTQGQVTQLSLALNPTSITGTLIITVNWNGAAPFYDYSANPILVKKGAWFDVRGVVNGMVLADNGVYKMWFTNFGILNGPYGTISLAQSTDGTTWTRIADTVLTPTAGAWDAETMVAGGVIKENGIYTMYYTSAQASGIGYNIGRAVSQDGIQWTKKPGTIMPSVSNIAGGSTVKVNGQYYLYYHTASSPAINLATSLDGVTWQAYSGNPVLTGGMAWEGGAVTLGNVMYENNVFTMIYNNTSTSQSFGLATSTDGKNWTKDARNPVFTKANTLNAWAPYAIAYPFLVRVVSDLRIYYTGILSDGTDRLGFAVKK